MTKLETQVRSIIIEVIGASEEEVTLVANLFEDLGCDSLDQVEIIMEFEKIYGLSIPDDKLDDVKTVSDCVRLIEELLKEPENYRFPAKLI